MTTTEQTYSRPTCGSSTWDGNRDDPSYAYCVLAPNHAGLCDHRA